MVTDKGFKLTPRWKWRQLYLGHSRLTREGDPLSYEVADGGGYVPSFLIVRFRYRFVALLVAGSA